MFQSLRIRFFWLFYGIMAPLLTVLSVVTYLGVSKILYGELDKKLETLADVMIQNNQLLNSHQTLQNSRPRSIPNEVGIEWFDANGYLIASQGQIPFSFPPEPGIFVFQGQKTRQSHSYPIRTFTLKVSIDRSALGQPSLEGYLRLSQSTRGIEQIKNEMFWFLVITVSLTLGLVGIAGLWLTQQAVKPVEYSVEKLKQFTADASHELRTPLTSIKSCMEVIFNHPERIHPKDAKKLATIASATEKMTYLVEDLLFLARNDNNSAKKNQSLLLIDLKSLLKDLIELLDPLAQEKAIILQAKLETEVKIRGDRQQISRLFTNLMENAIKYTPDGGKVWVSLKQTNRYVLVSVEDTGIGIEKEQLSKVFDRFWRADQSRQKRGTGLGLSIAQAIAQHHGGKITVSSQIGEGTCFQVCLPFS